MTTTAIEEGLAEIGRRIDRLDARAGAGAGGAKSQIQRHLDTLRQGVSRYADAVEDKLRQLEIKLDIAEHRLASEFAGDARTFGDAVEVELHDWDTYVERLQVKAATKAQAGSAREQIEAAIRELRQHRNSVAERLAEVRAASAEAWHERKKRVAAAREELGRGRDRQLVGADPLRVRRRGAGLPVHRRPAVVSGVNLARGTVIALLALAYSSWAIWGAGFKPVTEGFMLRLGGIPVFLWVKWRRSRQLPGMAALEERKPVMSR